MTVLNLKNLSIPGRVKRFIYHPSFYNQGCRKNILLFSSRRSGSTLLAQIICSNPGIRYVDQPFDLFKSQTKAGKIKLHYLPQVPHSQFIGLSSSEYLLAKEYVTLILQGKLKQLGGIERLGFPLSANRTLMKICNASSLIDWFNTNFDVLTCYLVRHPIPQSLSVMRNHWGITADAYVNNQQFVDSYLNEEQVKFARKILSDGTYFQKSVLNWCFENLVPLKYCHSNCLKIKYEELVLNPIRAITLIAEKLDLEGTEEMLRRMDKPSKSSYLSHKETQNAIFEGDRNNLVNSWRSKVSDEQLNDANFILELFRIHEYKIDKYLL